MCVLGTIRDSKFSIRVKLVTSASERNKGMLPFLLSHFVFLQGQRNTDGDTLSLGRLFVLRICSPVNTIKVMSSLSVNLFTLTDLAGPALSLGVCLLV